MRFIAVVHGWHVDSNGFDVHQFDAESLERAEEIAAKLKNDREGDFDRCAVKLIPIGEHEIWVDKYLSLGERLTGRINL